jgi:hypothetical protein
MLNPSAASAWCSLKFLYRREVMLSTGFTTDPTIIYLFLLFRGGLCSCQLCKKTIWTYKQFGFIWVTPESVQGEDENDFDYDIDKDNDISSQFRRIFLFWAAPHAGEQLNDLNICFDHSRFMQGSSWTEHFSDCDIRWDTGTLVPYRIAKVFLLLLTGANVDGPCGPWDIIYMY